jgi:hypothetical protein
MFFGFLPVDELPVETLRRINGGNKTNEKLSFLFGKIISPVPLCGTEPTYI